MNISATATIESGDRVRIRNVESIPATFIYTDTVGAFSHGGVPVLIRGDVDERADFLRRLAAAAVAAADELDAVTVAAARREQAAQDRAAADIEALRVKLTGGAR